MKKLYILAFTLFLSVTNSSFSLSLPARPEKNQASTSSSLIFTPTGKYSGSGLQGIYFENQKVAKIFDPTGKNPQTYVFEQVTEAGITSPKNLDFIGTIGERQSCKNKTCMAMRQTKLYGALNSSSSNKQ